MSQNSIKCQNEADRVHHSKALMDLFLSNQSNCYAILQLQNDESCALELFSSTKELHRMGKKPDIDHYEVVHFGNLPEDPANQGIPSLLESLYETYNINRPADFTGHSLSASDVIALKIRGQISCHYVDSVGFQQLSGFLKN